MWLEKPGRDPLITLIQPKLYVHDIPIISLAYVNNFLPVPWSEILSVLFGPACGSAL